MPKVSIIIPLYNKAPYIRKALDSVCAQTYQDWECIIMDDGSTDGSAELAEQIVADLSDSRFCIFRQANAGVSAARNNAVLKGSGKYLCFLDADDWWESSFLEEMVRFTERVPEAGLWASNYIYYKPGKTRFGVTNLAYIDHAKGIINYPRSYYQGTGMPIWTGAVLMHRSVFDEFGGFPLGVRLGEDFLLWARVALRYPVAFFDKPLAYYNNDVPSSLRLTKNLQVPRNNMLFCMNDLSETYTSFEEPLRTDWSRLLDKLRISGLLDYWMDSRYHNCADNELQKVNWAQFPASARKPYQMPIWQLKMNRKVRAVGSYCKQIIIKLLKIR